EGPPSFFQPVIKTTGQILPAPGDESGVVANSNGTISYANRKLAVGSAVKQGELLFYIASKNLNEGDYYSRVRANYEKAKAEYERAQMLVKDKIVSQKEYEAVQLNYQNAKIAYDAISGKQSAQGVGVSSPLSGHIKNILVKDGEYVTAGQTIATVSQNRRLVLRADVSEKHYAALPTIQSANFKTPYDNQVYALSELSGRLLSTGKTAETNTFFVPVTFEFDNQGNVIPGSFVEIYLLSSSLESVISIPVSALTNEMGHFYVYKQLDEEGYQKQEVKTGLNDGRSVQIISGLNAGDRIVTRGAYQVKMASASAAIPGHTHEH
ncbi:MAG: efflux RND transporter periplasmic adaptor subunit, partial [Odoribacter sp.]|nr:efflux RND transporter periplasmic adaptor subunit [Odoribacter sp.]